MSKNKINIMFKRYVGSINAINLGVRRTNLRNSLYGYQVAYSSSTGPEDAAEAIETIDESTLTDQPTAQTTSNPVTIIPPVHTLCNAEDQLNDSKISLVAHLQSRHLVESISNDDLFDLTKPNSKKFKLYCGADPTAKSLHLGNLLPLLVLLHFRLHGHDVVGLVGGATGAVGDPSGRSTERDSIDQNEREDNVERIQSQIEQFLHSGIEYAKTRNYPVEEASVTSANNATWWSGIKMLDFLATFGRHIRISSMLARDSVLSRLESQAGLGFNEFTYQILQAYDFWHLYNKHGVNMQIGGNDQWGNITAGIDLIGRLNRHSDVKDARPAYGLTVPLLTTPTGEKFGKSAGNAVFIDKELTSPFQLYQYFINVPDEIVSKLLKTFTLLPILAIDGISAKHEADPGLRLAQRILAREVVDLLHGSGYGQEMAYVTGFLFPTPDQPFNDEVSAEKLISVLGKSGILQSLSLNEFSNSDDLKMSTLLATVFGKSKRETKNLIQSGGVYLGLDRTQFEDPEDVVLFDKLNHLIEGRLLLVRVGKQQYHVVDVSDVESDGESAANSDVDSSD